MDTVEIAPVAEASFPLIKTEIETCLGLTGDSMAPRMPPVNNREELYRNWLDWVTTNLGRDQHLAGVAATAATDAAELGNGFNVAVKAATAAWSEAAKATRTGPAQALTETEEIDHTRTERRAVVACACGIALWLWPFVAVVLVLAGEPDNTGPLVGVGVSMLMAGLVAVPIFFFAAILCGHSARRRVKRLGLPGGSYATAGLVLGYAAVPAALLGIPVLFALAMAGACCY